MGELLDKIIGKRDSSRLNYVNLAEKYTETSWNVVKLSDALAIRENKLNEIQEIIESENTDLIDSFYKIKKILDN